MSHGEGSIHHVTWERVVFIMSRGRGWYSSCHTGEGGIHHVTRRGWYSSCHIGEGGIHHVTLRG